MKTVVFEGIKQIAIKDIPAPTVPKDKILIKVDCCALCTWEQRVYAGVKKVDFPYIGGHEIAGEILEIGLEVQGDWAVGDKVVFGTNLACGYCYYCTVGEEQNCLSFDHNKQQFGLPYKGMGGLSEFLIVDPSHLFRYEHISPIEASLIEPLSCVVHSIETAEVQLGDYNLIIGAGIMGMFHLLLSQRKGAITIVSDVNNERLELARSLGANYVINPTEENLLEKVKLYTEGLGAQTIFNTIANPGSIPELLEVLSHTGTMMLYSSYYPDRPVEIQFDRIHKVGQKIKGTANSNKRDFIRASRLMSHGLVDVKPFINQVFPISQVEEAFHRAINTNAFRIVIDFEKERSKQ